MNLDKTVIETYRYGQVGYEGEFVGRLIGYGLFRLEDMQKRVANSCQICVTIISYFYLFRFFDARSLFVEMNEKKVKNTPCMLVPTRRMLEFVNYE